MRPASGVADGRPRAGVGVGGDRAGQAYRAVGQLVWAGRAAHCADSAHEGRHFRRAFMFCSMERSVLLNWHLTADAILECGQHVQGAVVDGCRAHRERKRYSVRQCKFFHLQIHPLWRVSCVGFAHDPPQEIKFGDNDTLSAITSSMIPADYLFLLTDVDGLYTSNPRKDPDAARIDVVSSIDAIRSQGKPPFSWVDTSAS